MSIRPDPDPEEIANDDWRALVAELQSAPLSDDALFGVAQVLAGLNPVTVRYDSVRTQGRVSFGRDNEYTDGVAVYLAPEVLRFDDPEIWEDGLPDGDEGRTWGQVD